MPESSAQFDRVHPVPSVPDGPPALTQPHSLADVLIVGGGLAGTSAAILLARAGLRVTLLERTKAAHHKVCGEFLSAEALHYLHHLGLDPATLGATPITTLRLTHRHRTTQQQLPFAAASLTRHTLDEALLDRARCAGATVLRGHTATSLQRTPAGWTAQTAHNTVHTAPTALLATGKHDLHGHARTAPTSRSLRRHDGLLALNQYFRLTSDQTEALRSTIEVMVFPGGYCGLQLVEDGTANLGLLLQQSRYQNWPNLLAHLRTHCPNLAQRLEHAEEVLPKPLAIAHIPYGFRRPTTEPNLWHLGDQAAVIPSFSGDGMSIALHSGVLAAGAILAGLNSQTFQHQLARQLRTPVTLATFVSRLLIHTPALTAFATPTLLRHIALRTRVPLA